MDAEDLLLRFEQWQNGVRQEVERQGRYSQALSAVLIVGAFIAGVQGQLLSSTLELDHKTLHARACNLISFLGLVLEICGTFFGSVNAVKLQLRSQRGARALDRMEECKGNLKILMKYLAKINAEKKKEYLDDATPVVDEIIPPSRSDSRRGSIQSFDEHTSDDAAGSGNEDDIIHSPYPLPKRHQVEEPEDQRGGSPTDRALPESPVVHYMHSNVISLGHNYGTVSQAYSSEAGAGLHGKEEDQLGICERISEGLADIARLSDREAPRPLLAGIDSVIEEVHWNQRQRLNADAAPPVPNTTGEDLKHIQLPPPKSAESPLEKISLEIVSLVAMGFGVLCLSISIILFAAARTDILGNQVWAACLAVLLIISLISALPFIPIPQALVEFTIRRGRDASAGRPGGP